MREDTASGFAVPETVMLADGLSADEAVAIALWNSASFQESVAALGFARADVVDAGQLANPVLSLLLPLGPKQLEATLRWPLELLWQRPQRVRAATFSLDEAAHKLVQSGLVLAVSVRVAHADLSLAVDRQRLLDDSVSLFRRIDELTRSRFAAGDIAELDARVAHVDAVMSEHEAGRSAYDVIAARERLRALVGLPAADSSLERVQRSGPPSACVPPDELARIALASRPDVRAAEIRIEAAAARLGWEKSKVLALTAVLDANGEGREGFEIGPGFDVNVPIFSRNQGGTMRAQTELQVASAAYVGVQQRVWLDVRESVAMLDQARRSRAMWHETVLAPLEQNLAGAERAYTEGESSYLFVLENSRRVADARLRGRELEADEQRAHARVERAVGNRCTPSDGARREP